MVGIPAHKVDKENTKKCFEAYGINANIKDPIDQKIELLCKEIESLKKELKKKEK